MKQLDLQTILFVFFFFSCTGWLLESIQESIIRKKIISKGFLKGPFVPCHGLGGICVYLVTYQFKETPLLVYCFGVVLCTAGEYFVAVFLDKCFKVKCWDYSTYPHTKFCHYKGSICLTYSLLFGVMTMIVVYCYWDLAIKITRMMGSYIWIANSILLVIFLTDVVYTCVKVLYAKNAGIKLKGYAVFTDLADNAPVTYKPMHTNRVQAEFE
ncbi:MAG: hypothetical protein Ta2G_09540 [Termitinemataceae bacterium]|nr:MAG: hypothetical protein Ta2G_09540 [Termitinemataceae bacterium]